MVYAVDLLSEYEMTGSLDGVLPRASGIYLWRLRLRPSCHPKDGVGVLQHVKRLSLMPLGELGPVDLSRGFRLNSLRLGGVGLPPLKYEALENMVSEEAGAKYLSDFLADLESRSPALYCGESGNLSVRIRDHLRCQSDFGETICSHEDISWSDLRLDYVVTGKEQGSGANQYRTAMEYLATLLTLSAYTKRAG